MKQVDSLLSDFLQSNISFLESDIFIYFDIYFVFCHKVILWDCQWMVMLLFRDEKTEAEEQWLGWNYRTGKLSDA